MSEMRDLYQEVILDHNKRPRNFHKLENANRQAEGRNPLCGDVITIYLAVEGDIVKDVSFQGTGCAISQASGSLMTDAIKGKTLAEVTALFDQFHNLVTKETEPDPESLGKLAVFSGVREFPMRVKCASLSWHTLRAALDNKQDTVTTE